MLETLTYGQEHFNTNGNLVSCTANPGIAPLVEAVRTDHVGGETLRNNISALAGAMSGIWHSQSEYGSGDPGIVVGIPRGGLQMGIGLSRTVPHFAYVEANQGMYRHADLPAVLLAEETARQAKHVLVGDTAVFTGNTIHETLTSLLPHIPTDTDVSVFIAVAYRVGLQRLCREFPSVRFYVAGIETETKPVWDPHYFRLVQTLANMGDIGQLVSR